ncbi:MAG TPA: alpha/beta hydrolase, partial [Acidimicrobiales bacterium]|nr:alpha/beta hydrolase [Acidimicrobiales bacterium]
MTVPLLPDAPAWFRAAVAVPYGQSAVEVDGCRVDYLHWGEPGRRGLVFVHGGGAHAQWWTHVAARFAGEFRVAAIDLSGHGDSGHREHYDPEQWADEVVAVAADAGIDGLPVVIGHSMGGFITIVTAARHADAVAGVIVCDSPVTEADPEISAHDAFGRPRTYPTLAAAAARFRTVPPQEHYLDYVVDFVARHSLKEVEGGWQWKFDRRIFGQFADGV